MQRHAADWHCACPRWLFSTAALQAQWSNEGLPTDGLSVENGAIVTSTARWPLLIDPQLQASGLRACLLCSVAPQSALTLGAFSLLT